MFDFHLVDAHLKFYNDLVVVLLDLQDVSLSPQNLRLLPGFTELPLQLLHLSRLVSIIHGLILSPERVQLRLQVSVCILQTHEVFLERDELHLKFLPILKRVL